MGFGVDHQDRDAQLLQGSGVVHQLLGHHHQVGLQGGHRLQVQLLHGTHLFLLQQVRGGHGVNGAGIRLFLQAHHPVGDPQGHGGIGGHIVAADQSVRRGVQLHLTACLVGEGDGGGGGALTGRGAARGGGAARPAAGGEGEGQGGRQDQGGPPCEFVVFHGKNLISVRKIGGSGRRSGGYFIMSVSLCQNRSGREMSLG